MHRRSTVLAFCDHCFRGLPKRPIRRGKESFCSLQCQEVYDLNLVLAPAAARDSGWYSSQHLSPETQSRLGVTWTSCCDGGDVFKTRFRSVENDGSMWGKEHYQYLKSGEWLDIPPDIIRHEKTPDGQPTLFLYSYDYNPDIPFGTPLCFIIDEGGT